MEKLIVFTRYPCPGQSKTRLVGTLGAEGAADLHRRMTEHALDQARALAKRRAITLEVHFTGGDEAAMRGWLGTDLSTAEQRGADLGERMRLSFDEAFSGGARAVIVMGTDCPALTADVLGRGFDALSEHDIVLGPARDGGYYLVGLTRRAPELFSNIAWGTGRVLLQTELRVQSLGLARALLEPLYDVDRPEDLVWAAAFLPPVTQKRV